MKRGMTEGSGRQDVFLASLGMAEDEPIIFDETLETLDQRSAWSRLRSLLLEGATSPPSDPVDPGYFEALRDRVRDETDRLADADVKAGHVVPHERVREWPKTLGTPDQQPAPFSWRK